MELVGIINLPEPVDPYDCDEERISENDWARIVSFFAELEPTEALTIISPFRKQLDDLPSPPNWLATIRISGEAVGGMRVPLFRDCIEVFGDADAVRDIAERVARECGAVYEPE